MTIKEIKSLFTQLEQYIPELKNEIDSAKSDLRNARTLKTQIENVVTSCGDLLAKLNDPTNGVDAKLTESQTNIDSILANATTAQDTLTTIESQLSDASTHVTEMETVYANFITIKQNIEDPNTGLTITLDEVKELRRKAKSASTNTDTLIAKAEKTLTQVDTYITNMETAYAEFEISKKKIDDPINGLEPILIATQKLRDDIKAVTETSNTLYAEIRKYRDEVSDNLKNIQIDKTASEKSLKIIKDNESISEEKKKSIDNLLKIASTNSSTSYFKVRKKIVTRIAMFWFIASIIFLLLAICFGQEIVNNIFTEKNIQVSFVISRAVLVTPILAFLYYSIRSYSKERNIAEQYAFKEISGATLEGHLEMVHRSLIKAENIDEKLTDLVIEIIRSIHLEPLELQKSSKLSVRVGNRLMSVTSEIKESLNDIKNGTHNTDN